MEISVIIPTYKPKDYIWECLDSLINQTFPKNNFEIILVLNGCSSPWKEDIENYIRDKMQGMNINFIHTLQGGVSNARNIALSVARGRYITFMDDDDFVSTKYLECLYKVVSEDTIAISYIYAFDDGNFHNQRPYRLTAQYNKLCRKSVIHYTSARKCFDAPWMKLIPKNYIKDRRFDIRYKNGEDSLFMFTISDMFENVKFTDKEACYYRRYRENSAVTTKRSRLDIINLSLSLIKSYSSIFLRNPFSYNWNFFFTRILATIKNAFE